MANTTVATGNINKRHLADFYREYVRMNLFSRYTGTDSNNVIVAKEESVTGRQAISIPAIGKLSGNGVSGSSTLRGSGEAMKNFHFDLTPTYYRNAVEFTKEELEKPNFDMFRAARPQLLDWAMEQHRDRVITAMESITNAGAQVAYASATEGQKDAWLVDNVDRVLFGAALSNDSGPGDHSAALGNIDTSADTLDTGIVSLAKRIAKTASPAIRPIRVNEGEEYFVAFTDSYSFRDLKTDSVMTQANREAMARGRENPLFKDGDLMWDGVIIREVPELNRLLGVGNSSSNVGRFILCGAQAVAWAIGRRPNIITDMEEDYNFQPGIAVEMKEAVGKMVVEYTSARYVDWGQVTVYTSSTADA